MRNILQWSLPEDLQGAEITYTVQYLIYGQKKWLNKSECRTINRTYCDLSAETSDLEHQYYARVKAILEKNCSNWAETGRFYPFLETQIGPPEVSLTTDEKSISIVLKAPEKWKKNPEESSISMQQIYSNMKYNVSIYNTKSNIMWAQSVTNHVLVLSWLEPDTLYCIHVQSIVPGPPRLAQPSERQCISTSKDQTPALKIKIIFQYILPISITVFIFSVVGFSMYKYIHLGKEKHPENLILIYRNGINKKFFIPAEKNVINFITLNILEDSKISRKDTGCMEKSKDVMDVNDVEACRDQEPHPEIMEVKHLGYASHLVEDPFCDSEGSTNSPSSSPQEYLCKMQPTDKAAILYEYDRRTTPFCRQPEHHKLSLLEEMSVQGKLFEQKEDMINSDPQTLQISYTPQLRDADLQLQEHMNTEEVPEKAQLTTLVDWDPWSGRLCIPSLSSFEHYAEEYEHPGYTGPTEEGLLSRLYQEATPDRPPEEKEAYLMQFMEEWGLSVKMDD
ncbi:interleukin-20 receptor subunit alpha isoform X1 [Suncus etruscus]|uniref:interleukin-20 receptor subunit alpha isoform X1 n=1 Tax=Suncus etruscus TaxID=109475 RepID=UPI002110AF67|nr:interleukin-20 receptor subunit alpha isoform X1 [Suncus etruscus]